MRVAVIDRCSRRAGVEGNLHGLEIVAVRWQELIEASCYSLLRWMGQDGGRCRRLFGTYCGDECAGGLQVSKESQLAQFVAANVARGKQLRRRGDGVAAGQQV